MNDKITRLIIVTSIAALAVVSSTNSLAAEKKKRADATKPEKLDETVFRQRLKGVWQARGTAQSGVEVHSFDAGTRQVLSGFTFADGRILMFAAPDRVEETWLNVDGWTASRTPSRGPVLYFLGPNRGGKWIFTSVSEKKLTSSDSATPIASRRR